MLHTISFNLATSSLATPTISAISLDTLMAMFLIVDSEYQENLNIQLRYNDRASHSYELYIICTRSREDEIITEANLGPHDTYGPTAFTRIHGRT